jgi:hypothetical protein
MSQIKNFNFFKINKRYVYIYIYIYIYKKELGLEKFMFCAYLKWSIFLTKKLLFYNLIEKIWKVNMYFYFNFLTQYIYIKQAFRLLYLRK